jgi:2-haloacid dehalogenase
VKNLRAFAFDAYGTLFDVFSVTALCDELFPGRGDALAQRWRAKQLQYSLLGSMMHRYRNFWQITGDALIYATKTLNLTLTAGSRQRLMDAYLQLSAFPDARPGLEALKKRGLSVAILSNGEPRMLDAAVTSAGLGDLIDDIISVDEVKVFKPDPRVYQLVGQRFRRATDEIGFVSSNSWDINGAGAAGLYTVWIRRYPEEPQEELGFPAQRILSVLTELESVVTQDS